MSVEQMYAMVAAKWVEVTDQIAEADWDKPTPCDGWCVRDVVEHAHGWQTTGGNAFGAELEQGADWSTIQAAVSSQFSDPANFEGSVEAFGGMSKQAVAGTMIGDLLVHSWDIARAIGADDTLPAEACASTHMGLQRMPAEVLRSENMFGPAIEVPADASDQDKLLGFVGRSV